MENIKISHLSRSACLLIGVLICSVGVSLIVQAAIGIQPWDVFHQGLANMTGISFGNISIIVGYSILAFSALFKFFPGPGTIVNIMVMGKTVDYLLVTIPKADNFYLGLAMNIAGAIILAFGTSLYLKACYGAGARDSLVMGLVHRLQIDTRYIKPVIEGIVLVLGIILGGNFGVGTFVSLFLVGFFIDLFLKIVDFDPKGVQQLTFVDIFNNLKGDLIENENRSN